MILRVWMGRKGKSRMETQSAVRNIARTRDLGKEQAVMRTMKSRGGNGSESSGEYKNGKPGKETNNAEKEEKEGECGNENGPH